MSEKSASSRPPRSRRRKPSGAQRGPAARTTATKRSAGTPPDPNAAPAPVPWLPWVLLAISFLVFALMAARYLPFLSDDALISLRYARRLLEGHGLTWTAGERVEGYSNLLWLLGCAGLGALRIDLITAARILGFGGVLAAQVALLRVFRPARPGQALPALAGILAIALSAPVEVWAVGGLEQPLVAALLAWTLVGCLRWLQPNGGGSDRNLWTAGGMLALLAWTRPDGALFAAACGAGLLAARGVDRRTLLAGVRLVALPAGAVAVQLAFRRLYYGEWIPNSAYAKLAFTGSRVEAGARYLFEGLGRSAPLLLPALVLAGLALRDRTASGRVRFLLLVTVVWCAYVVLIGGDIFPAWRHLVPVVILAAFLAAEGVRSLLARRPAARRAAWIATPLCLLALAWMPRFDPEIARARSERWEWDGQVVGRLLKTGFARERPLLAVDPAGTLPYFSELPAIDMLGINDRYLARHRPDDFGEGWLGHELGNGRYVLEREPDLILFCTPAGGARPCFRSGREMVEDPRFTERYRLVTFEGHDPYLFRSQIWTRAEGGRVGMTRGSDEVSLPGYLLTASGRSVVRLDPQGRLATAVRAGLPAGYAGLPLSPGRWRGRVEHDGPAPNWVIADSGSRDVLASGAGEPEFQLGPGGEPRIDLLLRSPPGSTEETRIRRVRFERVEDATPGKPPAGAPVGG